jgi:cell division protein FtsL
MAAPTTPRRRTTTATFNPRVLDGSGRMATASAHNRALAAVPQHVPRRDDRPPLRLVDDARAQAADRRRRARLIAIVGSVLAAGIFFLLAAFNAMLVTGQSRIDALQEQVRQAQAEYSANRLETATLESPDHVVSVAKEKLGMVPPPRLNYLTPSEGMAAQVAQGHDVDASATPSGGDTAWAETKPYLGATP